MAEESPIYDAGEPEPVYASTEERIAAFLAQPQYAGSFGSYAIADVVAAIGPLVPPTSPDSTIVQELGYAIAAGALTPGVPE